MNDELTTKQWRRQLLIALALLLAALLGLEQIFQWRTDLQQRIDNLRQQTIQVQAAAKISDQEWSDYITEATLNYLDLEERFLSVSSHDLAQAEVQNWLTSVVAQYSAKNPQIEVVASPDAITLAGNITYWRVEAQIQILRCDLATGLAILNKLESSNTMPVAVQAIRLTKRQCDWVLFINVLRSEGA